MLVGKQLQVEAIGNEHTELLYDEEVQQWVASASVSAACHPLAKFEQGNKATLWHEPRAAGMHPTQIISYWASTQSRHCVNVPARRVVCVLAGAGLHAKGNSQHALRVPCS